MSKLYLESIILFDQYNVEHKLLIKILNLIKKFNKAIKDTKEIENKTNNDELMIKYYLYIRQILNELKKNKKYKKYLQNYGIDLDV